MEDTAETEQLVARDGATSTLRIFRAVASREAPAVLLAPALGTPASYYDLFARALALRGTTVVVTENRGTGTSSVRARRGVDYGYVDVLTHDWPAMVEATRRITGARSIVLVGHSIGGQLGALYEAQHVGTFDRLVLVTACSVEWRGWPGMRGVGFLGQSLVVGLVSRTLGVFPGDRMGFGGLQGARMMRDWSRQARTGVYAPTSASIDYERALSRVTCPVLSVAVRGDDYAPRTACDRLLAKMPSARIERVDLAPSWPIRRPTDAHFRWAREPATMVDAVLPFLRGV